ncbi:lysozyme inhibitor LprI family protein [Luteimonas sp. e5]
MSARLPACLAGLLGSLALLPALALAQAPDTACRMDGNQAELNACAAQELAAADRELNEVYAQVRRRHADDALFLDRLRTAQRRWIAFRDAEMEALFPTEADEDPRIRYGSVNPMCRLNEKARLTRERTAQLRAWLDGLPEGSVCSGSRPISGN